MTDEVLGELAELLGKVRLRLERDGERFAIGYEKEVHPLSELPLGELDPTDRRAELLAVAAAFEAAVKYPGQVSGGSESFREAAAPLLPKIERARFVTAYNAVVGGRNGGDAERLFARDFGAGLVVCYVQDQGWRFEYIVDGWVRGYETSPDTMHSVARSNLYARAEISYKLSEVAIGDGYDAARAACVDDVFYDRDGGAGIELAIPSRDLLMIGPNLSPEAVAHAFETAAYPISAKRLVFKHHRVSVLAD